MNQADAQLIAKFLWAEVARRKANGSHRETIAEAVAAEQAFRRVCPAAFVTLEMIKAGAAVLAQEVKNSDCVNNPYDADRVAFQVFAVMERVQNTPETIESQ